VTSVLSGLPLEGKPETLIMNDGKVSPDGRFFVGQMYIDGMIDLSTGTVLNNDIWQYMNTDDNGDLLYSEVYEMGPDGEVSTLDQYGYHLVTNGQAWSKDGEKYYVLDTILNTVTEFDYKDGGKISNGK
jgi:sugar lactone lactonase YvrE